jgi:NAD+--asparagine ADP-ribosyltransferase
MRRSLTDSISPFSREDQSVNPGSRRSTMTLDEYIKIFRDECQEHLPWEEARDMEAVFDSKHPRTIYLELSKLREAGRIPSKRFAKSVTDFYGQFC